MIFVFGSNLAGVHGSGSAREAYKNYGAVWGQGIGPAGKSYAIPTKDNQIMSMELPDIANHVKEFLCYAVKHSEEVFNVVAIGCGLAGFTPAQIAPMFKGASENVHLPAEFTNILSQEYSYGLHNGL